MTRTQPTPSYFQLAPQVTPVPRPPPPKEPKTPVKPPRKPLLRLEVRDLSCPGAKAFLSQPDSSTILSDAVNAVLNILYTSDSQIPAVRSITLVLRQMDGVAYTTGTELDDDHKEIHFNTKYIAQTPSSRQRAEILGVVTHEMVHVWQWNGRGTCPGGLIEGIADFVRLRAGFAAEHWRREWDGKWDQGYQHTGYFLDWLEEEIGEGTVTKINAALRYSRYKEEEFWVDCCGREVVELWRRYGKAMRKRRGRGDGDEGKDGEWEDEDGDEDV